MSLVHGHDFQEPSYETLILALVLKITNISYDNEFDVKYFGQCFSAFSFHELYVDARSNKYNYNTVTTRL